jgi:hypothetical protein
LSTENTDTSVDGVDPGELLEDLEEHGDDDLGPVAALEEVPERVLHLLRDPACLHDLVELRLHVVGAADLLEHRLALVEAAALDEAVGGVRHEERAQGEEPRRDAGQGEGQAPAPWVDLARAVVHQVREEDADGHVQLEQDVEPAADPRRRDLGQEQGNGLHMRMCSSVRDSEMTE